MAIQLLHTDCKEYMATCRDKAFDVAIVDPPFGIGKNWTKDRSYEASHMSEAELAWHSFNVPVRIVKNTWNGFIRSEKRYGKHPHEKPVGLYKWLLKNYVKPGSKIIDTHLGGGSIAIACHDLGFDLTACEIDAGYFSDTVRRYQQHAAQTVIF